ncbi:hypothetical protein GT037_010325 [Alternaria burnsii]|uniref:Uncharacterized protein n=1 Tax=Alternaria burnsii TaxID=1187904 RepID=A0A8H7AXN4_9PLEO|nr:uncharacterized protein GT037_010325 [Alternaria burnsii]KAF7671513.1 hypothetical protein GT037_010325 [Alternaria burnsii]
MAPRKTTAGDKIPKAKKASTVKKSEDKVIKRPARGYHKFRNGLLNVAPKGDEKELTKQNRTSPLLRLPPEIRNIIWKLVLGGKVYRTWLCGQIGSSPTHTTNAMALLRTCRQVYAEAAIVPLTLTMFSTDYPSNIDDIIMASRKLDFKNQKASTKGTKAFTDTEVVKRRYKKVRFHEDGLLNVERKTGKYFKIARENQQDSLLLRLPPELRCLVFEYVLGGNTYEIRYHQKSEAVKHTTISKHALALLSVCRQIFAETALLPFGLNTFSVFHPLVFNIWIKGFHLAFAEVVTSVRINILAYRFPLSLWYKKFYDIPRAQYIPLDSSDIQLSSVLTSLKVIQIAFIVKATSMEDTNVMEKLNKSGEEIRGFYELANSGIKVNLTRKLSSIVPLRFGNTSCRVRFY